jgi:hypothetical protein
MDDRFESLYAEVCKLRQDIRQHSDASLAPDVLNNMLLLAILDELQELNKSGKTTRSSKVDVQVRAPKANGKTAY